MFDYSGTELATIDGLLDPKLGWAKTRYAEAHQLALDSTRLLSCTQDRLDEYKSKGFFKRIWYKLSGKTGDIQRANQADLLDAQKIGWRYLELLNERDLLQAQSIIAVRNNLLTLATKEEGTRKEVARLAERVYERFVRLEQRVDKLEAAQQIHGWLLTIETNDYDEKYPPHLRMLRVVNDFLALKPGSWTMGELRYLQKALKEVGIDWKRELSLEDFVNEVITEIESFSFQQFHRLLIGENGEGPPAAYVLENVAVPSYTALFEVANSYTASAATIDVLREHLKIDRVDAIRAVLKAFMGNQGINLGARMQLRMLAVEILDCAQLVRALQTPGEKQTVETEQSEPQSTASAARRVRKTRSASPSTDAIPDLDPECEAARMWGTSLIPVDFHGLEQRLSACRTVVRRSASQASLSADVVSEIVAAQEQCRVAQTALAQGYVILGPLWDAREKLFELDTAAGDRLRSLALGSASFLPTYWASCQVRLVLVAVEICLGEHDFAQLHLLEAHELTNGLVSALMDLESDFDAKYDTINALLSADKLLVQFGREASVLADEDAEGGEE